jgi:hypothetical protein
MHSYEPLPPHIYEERLRECEKKLREANAFHVENPPSVIKFAIDMAKALKAKQHTCTQWRAEDYASIEYKLDKDVQELHATVDCANGVLVQQACIEVANQAMMIYDKIDKEEQDYDEKVCTDCGRDFDPINLRNGHECSNCQKTPKPC